jgi:hypothetical protein
MTVNIIHMHPNTWMKLRTRHRIIITDMGSMKVFMDTSQTKLTAPSLMIQSIFSVMTMSMHIVVLCKVS